MKVSMCYRSILVFLTLLITACASGPRVHSVVLPDTDFQTFKTFMFSDAVLPSEDRYQGIEGRYLIEAIRAELLARGMTETNDADVLVNFHVSKKEKISSTVTPTASLGYYSYRGRVGYGSSIGMTTEAAVRQYTEGTLNIDVVDAAKKQVVWEGVAIGRLKEKPPEDLQGLVNSIVAEIFSQYPVVKVESSPQ